MVVNKQTKGTRTMKQLHAYKCKHCETILQKDDEMRKHLLQNHRINASKWFNDMDILPYHNA